MLIYFNRLQIFVVSILNSVRNSAVFLETDVRHCKKKAGAQSCLCLSIIQKYTVFQQNKKLSYMYIYLTLSCKHHPLMHLCNHQICKM